jgi:hypothetical protein
VPLDQRREGGFVALRGEAVQELSIRERNGTFGRQNSKVPEK